MNMAKLMPAKKNAPDERRSPLDPVVGSTIERKD
jgi:hypothetical protein